MEYKKVFEKWLKSTTDPEMKRELESMDETEK